MKSALFFFALSFLAINKAIAQPTKSPNIIFILTDDQRFDAIGYAGNNLVHTPEMDKLAKEGSYFKNAMVTTPICAASRASILTGLYERTHRFDFQSGDVKEQFMSQAYPRILMDNGYETAFFGKFGIKYGKLDKLFDQYESYDRNGAYPDKRGYYYKTIGIDTVHLTRYTGQKALDFIEKTSKDEPFCLSLSFSAPHAHDNAEDQYFWQSTTDPLLQNVTIPDANLGDDKYFNALPEEVREGFNRVRWTWRYDSPEKYQHSVKGYYRMISGIDLEIGKIRKKLKEQGLDKNTVIILMGDNGYFLGERQLAGKWLMYDNSVRVPLLVFDPRQKKQEDEDFLALNIDVPATILDLAGVNIPEQWHGVSLLNKNKKREEALLEHLWEFDHIPPSEGLRSKDWKYFRYVNDKSIEELYDLNKDPREANNLANREEFKSKLHSLRSRTDELIKAHGSEINSGPSGLTVETIRDPSGVSIIDLTPEFGWEISSEANFQTAYQLLVASSLENIQNNIGDMWDTGEISSSASNNVEYDGKALMSNQKYYWKVRIWDEIHRSIDYSDHQKFTTGKSGNTLTSANKFLKERIAPVALTQLESSTLIDFGKAAFATLEFEYDAKEDETLVFHLGEKLDGDHIDRDPGGHIRYQKILAPVKKGTHSYLVDVKMDHRHSRPAAVTLPDSFPVLMPFRYVELEQPNAKINKEDFTQLAFFNYWENDNSSFKSSDDILNQVWDLCKYSIKATSFAGLYVDGDRERIPYEADAYLNQLSHYTTDNEYAIARQTIEYFMEYPTWPTEWQQHVALMFHADYMYTGNSELIERYYKELKHKTLYELSDDRGLITSEKVTPEFMYKLGFKEGYPKPLTDIVDWPSAGWGGDPNNKGERDGYVFKPFNTVVNAFYFENMKIMAEFAEILGKTDDVLNFELRAAKAKKALNELMFDKNRGIYIDGIGTEHASLHANMMPLAFGMVPEEHFSSVVDFIKSRGMACSVYGSQFLMDGLYNAGEEDYALELLASTEERSWYNMIRIGSTVTLEAWDFRFKNNLDWNHAWGAVPANIIPRGLWGIQPKTPGFSVASIKPQMSSLKESSIEVPTVMGNIKGDYKYVNSRRQIYTIDIPANMVAEFEVGDTKGKMIKLNGEKVNLSFGNIRLMPGKNVIELAINSF